MRDHCSTNTLRHGSACTALRWSLPWPSAYIGLGPPDFAYVFVPPCERGSCVEQLAVGLERCSEVAQENIPWLGPHQAAPGRHQDPVNQVRTHQSRVLAADGHLHHAPRCPRRGHQAEPLRAAWTAVHPCVHAASTCKNDCDETAPRRTLRRVCIELDPDTSFTTLHLSAWPESIIAR